MVIQTIARYTRLRRGAAAIEYAIAVGIVVAGIGGALWVFMDDVENAASTAGTKLEETAKGLSVSLAKPST